jgi:hypothetical protein
MSVSTRAVFFGSVAIFGTSKTLDHSPKAKLVVTY